MVKQICIAKKGNKRKDDEAKGKRKLRDICIFISTKTALTKGGN